MMICFTWFNALNGYLFSWSGVTGGTKGLFLEGMSFV